MSKKEKTKRERYVTKGVRESIDNILQHIIWEKFVTPMKLKKDEIMEIRLMACPFGNKQRIEVEDDLGRNIDTEKCYIVPKRSNEEIIVFYDSENNSETMLLRSESPTMMQAGS